MKAPLFRQAAVDAQHDRLYGHTCIARGPRSGLLVLAALLAVVSLVVFAAWGRYTRKEHVLGYLAPTSGLIKVYTPQAGTVLERRVSEGQSVRQGEVLMVISSDRSSARTRDAQAAVLEQLGDRRDSLRREQGKQAQIDQLAAASVQQRIRGLSAEIEQARAQLELQRSRVASAETTIGRYENLVVSHFMSDAALQQKQEELLDQRGQLASLQRSIAALTRDLDAARTELAASALRQSNNAAQLERQVSELQQQFTEADSRRSVVLTAAAAGVVTTILADVGQSASTSAPLMSILPAGASLEAQLLVPTRAAGFIKPGQKVALRYQAFPYQRFGHHEGEVTRVGRGVIQPGETALPVAVNEPVYRVTVKLPSQGVMAYGQAMSLQSGMGVDADIWLDSRRIVEWFFEPILSVTGRV